MFVDFDKCFKNNKTIEDKIREYEFEKSILENAYKNKKCNTCKYYILEETCCIGRTIDYCGDCSKGKRRSNCDNYERDLIKMERIKYLADKINTLKGE